MMIFVMIAHPKPEAILFRQLEVLELKWFQHPLLWTHQKEITSFNCSRNCERFYFFTAHVLADNVALQNYFLYSHFIYCISTFRLHYHETHNVLIYFDHSIHHPLNAFFFAFVDMRLLERWGRKSCDRSTLRQESNSGCHECSCNALNH